MVPDHGEKNEWSKRVRLENLGACLVSRLKRRGNSPSKQCARCSQGRAGLCCLCPNPTNPQRDKEPKEEIRRFAGSQRSIAKRTAAVAFGRRAVAPFMRVR